MALGLSRPFNTASSHRAGSGLATELTTTPDQIRQLISASKIMPEALHLTKLLRAFKIRAERRSISPQCTEKLQKLASSQAKSSSKNSAGSAQPRNRYTAGCR